MASLSLPKQARDFTGKKFKRLTVLEYVGKATDGELLWRCLCDCGKETVVRRGTLGKTISCGCAMHEWAVKLGSGQRIHGMHDKPEYDCWAMMLGRCYNKNNCNYKRYGALGVEVCEGWRASFEAFFAVMGLRPSKTHSIDRIDGKRGYRCGVCADCLTRGETPNCRWATKTEQSRNLKNNRQITFRGQTKLIVEWAEELGMSCLVIRGRIDWGWPIELAMTAPLYATLKSVGGVRGPGNVGRREKARAQGRLRRAVKKGEVIPPAHCQHPGCTNPKVQAHHHRGYEREFWLDVVWLCRPHHEQADHAHH